MQTIRTLSNISYNTLPFFEATIEKLYKQGVIDWCYWIFHHGDIDEKKDHIHFTFKPSKRIDTAKFRELLYEYDPTYPEKPLTCTPRYRPNNSMDDWLLYAIHDKGYLAYKHEYRNFYYKYEDLRATDYDALSVDFATIDRTKYYLLEWLAQAVQDDVPFWKLVQDGLVPISQRAQYEAQYNAIHRNKVLQLANRKRPHEEEQDVLVPLWDDESSPFDVDEDGQVIFKEPTQGETHD